MISKIIFAVSILSGVGILWILNFTTPLSVGPFGVLGFFFLTYLFAFGIISLFLYSANRILYFVFSNLSSDFKIFSKKHEFIYFLKYSAVLPFAPIALIAQQSIGRMGIFEFLLVIILEIIACVYISKR